MHMQLCVHCCILYWCRLYCIFPLFRFKLCVSYRLPQTILKSCTGHSLINLCHYIRSRIFIRTTTSVIFKWIYGVTYYSTEKTISENVADIPQIRHYREWTVDTAENGDHWELDIAPRNEQTVVVSGCGFKGWVLSYHGINGVACCRMLSPFMQVPSARPLIENIGRQ